MSFDTLLSNVSFFFFKALSVIGRNNYYVKINFFSFAINCKILVFFSYWSSINIPMWYI